MDHKQTISAQGHVDTRTGTPDHLTCPVGRGPDEGGQHLDGRVVVGVLLQASDHVPPEPMRHLLQLLQGQTEGLQALEQLQPTQKQPQRNFQFVRFLKPVTQKFTDLKEAEKSLHFSTRWRHLGLETLEVEPLNL